MSDPARNLIGGRYEIIVPLGKGGMGIVYKAYDPVLDRSVAIKKMVSAIVDHDEFRQRFFIEARAIARLNHPNIVTIHELEEHEGDIYIVMEMLEGLPLSTLLKSAIIPLPAQLAILAQACSGLDYAHARGIVHRDIKPANLLLTTTGGVKIVDFGIARLATADVTRSGAMLGTPHYMSPEQINGQDVDYRSDWFSYGACAYELITGVRPFEASSMAPLLMKISNAAHQPLPEIDPDTPLSLTTVVDRLLSKDREQRPENGAEILRALNAAGDTNRHDVLGEVVRNAMGAAGEMTIVEPLSPARGLTTPLVGAKPTTPIAISLKTPTATPVTPVTPVRVTPAAPAAPATPASASASQQSQGQPPSTEVLWVSGLEGAPSADVPVAAASAPSAGSPSAQGSPGASGAAGLSGSAASVRSPGALDATAASAAAASGLPSTIPAGPPGAASASSAPASASASSGGASGSSFAASTAAAAAGDATVPAAAGASAGAHAQTQPVISDIPPARKSLKGALLVVAALFFVLMLAGGGMVWWLLSAARSSSSAEAGVLRGVVAQLMTMIGRQPASTTSTSSSASTSTTSQPSRQPDASAASQSPAGDGSTQPASTTSAQGATGATDASTSASAASSAATQPGTGSTSAAGDQQTSAPVQSRETGSTPSVSSGATGSPTSTTGGSNATTASSNGAPASSGTTTPTVRATNTSAANANRTTSSTSTRATPVTGTGAHASNGANTSTAGRDVANAHDAAASTGGTGGGTAGDTAGPTTASGSASGDTTSHFNNTHDTRAPLNADTLSAFNRSSGSSSAPSLGYGGDVTNPAASVARIKDTLETYSDAIEKQDLDTLRSVRDPLAAAEAGLAQTANPTSVRFSDVEVHTDGRTAAVRAKRIVSVGGAVKSSAVVDIQLVRRPSGWVITEIH